MAIQGESGFAVDTTLNTALSATALTAYLSVKQNWPNGAADRFVIQVDSEKILISRRVGNTLTIAQRGYNGTTPASHTTSANVTVLGYETLRTTFDAPAFLAATSTSDPSLLTVIGLTGAVAASRYVGATTSGSSVSGTFALGDFIIDQSGSIWICTVAGTSGTWVQAGASIVGGITSGGIIVSTGNDTSAGATVTAPAVSSGVAFTPSTTKNSQVTFQINGVTGSYTITYGPTTGAENTLASAVPTLLNVGSVESFMVPKNWKVVLTLTTVTLASTLVTTF